MPGPAPAVPAAWAAVLSGLGTVADARWTPAGPGWVSATGRAELVVAGRVVTAAGPPVAGTRGGAWCPAGPGADDGFVVADATGALRLLGPDGGVRVEIVGRGRPSAPAVGGGAVAFVDETADACGIAVAPLAGGPARVVSRADWAFDPVWSPDGAWLAWHEWDAPAMPWDGSRIVVARPDGSDAVVVAGGPAEAVGQPRFAPAGPARLAFVSDRDGWAALHVVTGRGNRWGARTASPDDHEHAQPVWGPGQRSFAWSPDGTRLAWCRNEDGFARLVVGAADALGSGVVHERSRGWHHHLDWAPGGILGVRSGARTVPTVTVFEPDGEGRTEVARAPGAHLVDAVDPVEPAHTAWRADDGTVVHGLRYGPADPTRPLLVDVHGGPTDQAVVEWGPRVQAMVAAGWTVLRPDPRGSTGRGRGFTRALAGRWGVADVADVLAGIRSAVADGTADPRRIAVGGGSAGGFTALLVALAAPDLVRAVVTQYPVTDLHALATATHRFEAHVLDTLVGPLPAAGRAYRDRSPITHAAAFAMPMLVLQGADDVVVPADRTAAFVAAVRAAGGTVEAHVYPGEGHGWRAPETVVDAVGRVLAFLGRVMGGPTVRP